MIYYDKIRKLKTAGKSYFAERLITELEYAVEISKASGDRFDAAVNEAIILAYDSFGKNGAITKKTVSECEKILLPLQSSAKKTKLFCVSHAHIDMNWMWSYNETVAITLDTFRTILKLMKEYPDFTYSQSQTSTYRIVEENDPGMFREIQKRVKEGRWEVTASTWVEADKNMSDGESLARHILYTKQYFKDKFGLEGDDLTVDFEPDTFGHNASVPEILTKGNVKYYYHCRGSVEHDIYNWTSKSGGKILVYKDPFWYNAQITPDFIVSYPQLCQKNKSDNMLKVYGVGDHGGGPTRRDIEILMDMAQWPIAPTIEFSFYRKFFETIGKQQDSFPSVTGESNFAFTGCYSSQSRIKMANRTGENTLFASENISTLSSVFCEGADYSANFKKAWEKVMFNQFHDIVTGSGVRETREYALGIFQEAMGLAYAAKAASFSSIADRIDTSSISCVPDKNSFSEGAGVGFKGSPDFNSSNAGGFEILSAERGSGATRIQHLFNATQFERDEPVEITVWDYDYDTGSIGIRDAEGNPVKFVLLDKGEFWAHRFQRIALFANVPPFGYSTYVIRQEIDKPIARVFDTVRTETYELNILENEWLRAEFDDSMNLVRLTDKPTGEVLIAQKSGFFKLVMQNDTCVTLMAGNAWAEGYTMREVSLNDTECVRVTERKRLDGLRQSIAYSIAFRDSKIKAKVSLDSDAKFLRYEMDCDWFERYDEKKGIPALKFSMPFHYAASKYTYKIPFGTVERDPVNHDVPAICFGFAQRAAAPKSSAGSCIGLVTDTTYAFRGENNALELTLIRGSQFPDPCPEYGSIRKQIGIAVSKNDPMLFHRIASAFSQPLYYFSNTSHTGTLPMDSSFVGIEGDLLASAIKLPEDAQDGMILRVYGGTDSACKGSITFLQKISAVQCLDITEKV
ncbi:MAG: glycoside hydrolase family 38 N-terminal domain-containing protein, partial [Saccharofermentanales bacterium]